MSLDMLLAELRADPGRARKIAEHETSPLGRQLMSKFGVTTGPTMINALPEEAKPTFIENMHAGSTRWREKHIGRPNAISSVLVDATTCYVAQQMLSCEQNIVSPSVMLDLANFVNAVLMFDRVYLFKNADVAFVSSFNHAMGEDVLVELPAVPLDDTDHTDFVRWRAMAQSPLAPELAMGLYMDSALSAVVRDFAALRDAGDSNPLAEDRQAVILAWQCVLGREFDTASMFPHGWFAKHWSSIVPFQLEKALKIDLFVSKGLDSWEQDQEELADAARANNFRCRFNLLVAEQIELPYSASTYRMPYRRAMYGRAALIQRHLALLDTIDDEHRARVRHFAQPAEESDVQMPFFLRAALMGLDRPDQIVPRLAQIRQETRRLRAKKRELDDILRDGSSNQTGEIERIRRAMTGEISALSHAAAVGAGMTGFAAMIAYAAGTVPAMGIPAVLLLTAGGALAGPVWDELQMRLTRPHYVELADVASHVQSTRGTLEAVSRIWGVGNRQLEKLDVGLRRIAEAF